VLFYRVCHRTRKEMSKDYSIHRGPYTCAWGSWSREIRNGLVDMNERHSTDNVHLTVGSEWGVWPLPFDGEFVCGFTSPEKLAGWFEGYFELLLLADFVVRVWDIPSADIEHGEVQSVARIDFVAGDPIREIDFDEIDRVFGKDLQYV
jgi:hypothetical protein